MSKPNPDQYIRYNSPQNKNNNMSNKTPQELFEEQVDKLVESSRKKRELELELYELKDKVSIQEKNYYDAWINSRPRVRLKEDADVSWFIVESVYNHFKTFNVNKPNKFEFGKTFLSLRRWTNLNSAFTLRSRLLTVNLQNVRNRFDPVLVPAGKEFILFKEVKKNVTVPSFLFSSQTTNKKDYFGKYSLVAFPFSEITNEYKLHLNLSSTLERFDRYYHLKQALKNDTITHIFMIIPNNFLEKV